MSRPDKNRRKVYVAMSGGVDSSVAAALLKKRGFNVVGVFMKPWQPETVSSIKYPVLSMGNRNQKIHNTKYVIPNTACLWRQDREDAMKVAAKIGIPLLTWDFSKEYKKEVTDYMIREYKAGRTPNPDVMCNKHIKFGVFLKKALENGADYIATGHYVRKVQVLKFVSSKVSKLKTYKPENIETYKLLAARDKNKDQSYFLWTLVQAQLRYCLFPIGEYTKPEVRRMAKKFGLPTAGKKDSQGVCFIGPLNMKSFLKKYIKPKRGKILDMDRALIGTHDGAYYYTIGQRHGLSIGNGKGPYYVVGKDIGTNTLFVAKNNNGDAFCGSEIRLTDINFVAQRHSNILKNVRMSGMKVLTRTRYRQPLVRAKIVFTEASVRVLFETPQKAITPGQSAVFYKGSELLGGGIIK